MDFTKALRTLATFFEERGAPFAVIGGFGLHAYGLSRATYDLDLLTVSSVQRELVSYLETEGYETLHVSEGYSNHVHPDPAMGRLDFVYVHGDTASALFDRAATLELLPGAVCRVPRPEHLIAMKVLAMKNDPGRTLQELADIQALLRLPGVDENEVRRYFEQHGLVERFLELTRTS